MFFKPDIFFNIGGKDLRILSFSTTVGSFGSIGTISITTNRKQLREAEIKLIGLREQKVVTMDLFVNLDGKKKVQIFGGAYDNNAVRWSQEQVTLTGRDWSRSLIETSSAVSETSPDIQKIVTKIAQIHGLKPIIAPTTMQPGVEYKGEKSLNMSTQTHWSILQKLAQICGFEVRVSHHKELYFGPPPKDSPLRTLTWRPAPADVDATPLHDDFTTQNNVSRNKTFSVKVMSYNQTTNNTVAGEAVVLGSDEFNVSSSSGGTTINKNGQFVLSLTNSFVKSGTYYSAAGPAVATQLTDTLKGSPTYRFNVPGLTPAQAIDRAKEIALDIAKREFVVESSVRPILDFAPHDRIALRCGIPEDDLEGYSGRDYTAVRVGHSWSMQEGMKSSFSALAIPPGLSDDAAGALSSI